jgi:hypothetical protein
LADHRIIMVFGPAERLGGRSMNPKRIKAKERRRARKLAEEAWESVQQEQLDLAEKIIRRATATQPENPVLWNDQGMILALCNKEADAERAFYAALSLVPHFAEPYHHLAAIAMQRGWLDKATGLARRAVELAPGVATYRERLDMYHSLVESSAGMPHTDEAASGIESLRESEPAKAIEGESVVLDDLANRLRELDWYQLAQRLTREGCVMIGQLLDPAVCGWIRRLFDDDSLFAKTVEMNQPSFGQGVYRYFTAPVPSLLEGIKHAVYPYAAQVANDWQRLLGENSPYPETLAEFHAQCHDAGQTKPTAILLKYETGGFNALHRDLRGDVSFPIQLAIVLSPKAIDGESEGFVGGEFVFADVPETDKSHRRTIAASIGDAVLFCTRDRIVRVGQMVGLQPVKHGVTTITSGVRYVLGLPFHEYR